MFQIVKVKNIFFFLGLKIKFFISRRQCNQFFQKRTKLPVFPAELFRLPEKIRFLHLLQLFPNILMERFDVFQIRPLFLLFISPRKVRYGHSVKPGAEIIELLRQQQMTHHFLVFLQQLKKTFRLRNALKQLPAFGNAVGKFRKLSPRLCGEASDRTTIPDSVCRLQQTALFSHL